MTYKPMFPKKEAKSKSKNLVFKDDKTFHEALDKFFEENREGLIALGKS